VIFATTGVSTLIQVDLSSQMGKSSQGEEKKMLDCSQLTYLQMADIVRSIRKEVKERNPLFVNAYIVEVDRAIEALEELDDMEKDNQDSDED
jgi:hypothetical protein